MCSCYEDDSDSPISILYLRSMRESAGYSSKSSLSHTWLFDTRDDKALATQGVLLRTYQARKSICSLFILHLTLKFMKGTRRFRRRRRLPKITMQLPRLSSPSFIGRYSACSPRRILILTFFTFDSDLIPIMQDRPFIPTPKYHPPPALQRQVPARRAP